MILLWILSAIALQDPKPEPLAADKAEDMFVEAYQLYSEQDYPGSSKLFEKIFQAFPKEPIGAIAAYNLACNSALEDQADRSVEWLGKAFESGYDNLAHVEEDGDLETIREHKKYAELVEKVRKEDRKARAPIKLEDAPAFAGRLVKAKKDGEGAGLQALFSRLGWFVHKETVESLNKELRKKGFKLTDEGGSWDLVEEPGY
jgi:hypothetical protein